MLQQAGLNCTISYQNRNVTCAKKKEKGVCQRGRGGGRLSLWPSVTVTVPQTHAWLMNLVTNKRKVGIAASNVLFHSWSLIFRFYHSGIELTFYLPLYFIPFIKIADGRKFLRSHFRRPDQVKCKNHLKFRNIGLTVEQMSDSLLVFSLDFLLCLFWKHTSNLEDWPDVCFPNWNTHEQRNHFPRARFNVTNGFHDSFVCF